MTSMIGMTGFVPAYLKDWEQMCLGDEKIKFLLDASLNLCRDGNQHVRASACKNIGQFCTHYMQGVGGQKSSTHKHTRSVVDTICSYLNLALLDEKPHVRSMVSSILHLENRTLISSLSLRV